MAEKRAAIIGPACNSRCTVMLVAAAAAAAARRWPEQCDVRSCQRHLRSCFEHARAGPTCDALFGPDMPGEQAVEAKDILKR